MTTRLYLSVAAGALALLLAGPLIAQQQNPGPLPAAGTGTYGPPISAVNGHISFGNGLPPTPNSACGTGATVTGVDSSFRLTSGTSSSSACTVNFSVPWNNIPNVSMDQQSGSLATFVPSRTGINLSGVADNTIYNFIVIGQPGG